MVEVSLPGVKAQTQQPTHTLRSGLVQQVVRVCLRAPELPLHVAGADVHREVHAAVVVGGVAGHRPSAVARAASRSIRARRATMAARSMGVRVIAGTLLRGARGG